MRTCYYELLEVQTDADDIELKKAYRRKALQYHPDKNPDNVEESTRIFATIRAAYEVLSDPQERAWYDSHKQQILSDEPIGQGSDNEFEVDSSVTGVTTDELLMFFNSALYTRMDDSPAGVYQIAGKVFAKLAKDEVNHGRRLGVDKFSLYQDDVFETSLNSEGYVQACEKYTESYQNSSDSMLFPPFGSSVTSYEYLKGFYRKWSEFSTLKSFSWKDEYMYSRNYDRRTKREVNKRNEKVRQQARSEYNKTVKRFVVFIKKLDKRMKEGAKKAEELKRANARQRQKELKDAYLADRRDKLANEFELQGWQAVDENNFEEMEKLYANESGDQTNLSDNEEEEIIVYDCFLCNKRFKSEKQLENHCNTKMHKRKVVEIRREMKEQSITLGLDDLSEVDDFDSADEQPYDSEKQANDEDEEESNEDDSSLDSITEELAKIEEQLAQMGAESSEDSESEPEQENRDKILDDLLASLTGESGTDDADWLNKRAKGKSKKAQKQQETQPNGSTQPQVCVTCHERFDSRNKLFKHVQSSGHAALRTQLQRDTKNKKNKKNKHRH
ncbi:hypothetical protein HG537_0C00330 [Torulaspora globosa]|uniref:J domain-containing protein n=1 Tax=Torulaspora globosa TaxID=48254 RepID=A0A7H9HQA4_9SACH|nr:hypothetical protein HG537_0C00330 [Torulaspora sp. CBS 2947]